MVQEILVKSFDDFCKKFYEKSLTNIDAWLKSDNENTKRVVTEGLRIWINRIILIKILRKP